MTTAIKGLLKSRFEILREYVTQGDYSLAQLQYYEIDGMVTALYYAGVIPGKQFRALTKVNHDLYMRSFD